MIIGIDNVGICVLDLARAAAFYERLAWDLPLTFNMGADICDRNAIDKGRLAGSQTRSRLSTSTPLLASARSDSVIGNG